METKSVKVIRLYKSGDRIDRFITEMIGIVGRLYNTLKNIFFEKKEKPREIKTHVYKNYYKSLLYGSESWTPANKNSSKLKVMEVKEARKMKGITRKVLLEGQGIRQ